MGKGALGLCLLAALLASPGMAPAEEVPPGAITITLRDGSTLVGTILAEDETSVTLRTGSGVELKLPKQAIASREATPAPRQTPSPATFTDPNESRLMFAPTGRPLGKGNGYFSDHYVLFPGFAYGLTRNISVAGGISTVPGVGISEQILYVSASSAWTLGDKAAVAVGGFFAGAQASDFADFGAGALFGVATFGPSDRSLSVGLAAIATREGEDRWSPQGDYLGTDWHWRFRDAPVVMVGGSLRLARSVSLISESWLFLGSDFDLSQQPFGFALRFFGGRLSADVGVVLVADVLDEGFPVPWLSFSYHFGPSRRATDRSGGPATPGWAQASARRGR
jgi:hypothetical protein